MNQKNYHEIFSSNLIFLLALNKKKQIDLSKDLNIPKATVSSWCVGTRLPKLPVILNIASYLNLDDPMLLLKENLKDFL